MGNLSAGMDALSLFLGVGVLLSLYVGYTVGVSPWILLLALPLAFFLWKKRTPFPKDFPEIPLGVVLLLLLVLASAVFLGLQGATISAGTPRPCSPDRSYGKRFRKHMSPTRTCPSSIPRDSPS